MFHKKEYMKTEASKLDSNEEGKSTQIDTNNLQQRMLSGFSLIAIIFVGIFIYRPLFIISIILAAILMFSEWFDMTKKSIPDLLLGFIILPAPIVCILMISDIDDRGLFLMTYILTISAVDVMAMFGGKFFKGPKLIKPISPKKTISGLASGVIAAGFVPVILQLVPGYNLGYLLNEDLTSYQLSFFSMILALIAQASDLFISIFKRKFKIKDSGNIIPGHGGVLDRMDSYILTAPMVLVFLHSNII